MLDNGNMSKVQQEGLLTICEQVRDYQAKGIFLTKTLNSLSDNEIKKYETDSEVLIILKYWISENKENLCILSQKGEQHYPLSPAILKQIKGNHHNIKLINKFLKEFHFGIISKKGCWYFTWKESEVLTNFEILAQMYRIMYSNVNT